MRQAPEKYFWWKMLPYKNKPERFAEEMLGFIPTDQQRSFFRSIANGTHVAVKSGHGTGKTAADAVTIIWWMLTREHARVPCTAPSEAQLKDVLWAELSKWHMELHPFFRGLFVVTSDRFYHKEYDRTWFAVARTARKEKPEALQGFHSGNLLFMIDEASGVAEEVFTVVRGALTEVGNRCVMTSNPTRTVGFFYNACTLWEDDPWTVLTFNGEESPRVSPEFVRQIAIEFGEDSDVYRVRVLGEFPLQSDYTLIPKHWIEAALKREADYPKKLSRNKFDAAGVDIARYGENKTVFVLVKGIKVVGILSYSRQNTMKTAGQIVGLCKRMNPNNIKIDEIGVGGGVVDRLLEQNLDVHGVDVSRPAIEKDKFANLRAEYYWNLRTRFEEGSISLKPIAVQMSKAEIVKLIEQLTSIRYEYGSNGKVAIWSKERMRREGIKSPDVADAMMLAFAEYYPELKPKRRKTWGEKWSDKLEQTMPTNVHDTYEDYANDFYRRSRYPITDDDLLEDMTW